MSHIKPQEKAQMIVDDYNAYDLSKENRKFCHYLEVLFSNYDDIPLSVRDIERIDEICKLMFGSDNEE